jgi:hypothetical protein
LTTLAAIGCQLIPVADGIDKSHLSGTPLEAGVTITVHSTIEQEGSSNLGFQQTGWFSR